LSQVIGILVIRGHVIERRVDTRLVTSYQFIKSGKLTLLGSGHQTSIVEICQRERAVDGKEGLEASSLLILRVIASIKRWGSFLGSVAQSRCLRR